MFAEHKHDRSVTFKQLRSYHGVTELKFVADDRPAERKVSSSVASDTLKTYYFSLHGY